MTASPRVTRRRFLAALGVGGVSLAAYARFGETGRLAITHPALDLRPRPDTQLLTIAQISDLHLQRVGELHRRVARSVAAAKPGLVVITGDSVDRAEKLPALAEFLALLDPRVPGYAILGNWEHWGGVDLDALTKLYARHNIRLLVNETAIHPVGARHLAITGLDDLVGGRPNLARAVEGAEAADARILLAHCPEHRDRLRDSPPMLLGGTAVRTSVDVDALGFRMMLSGHTHGGQVAPLGLAMVLPPGSGRYVRGWYRDPGEIPMYVSRGIGTSMLPVRLGSVPEVAVFGVAV